MSNTPITKSATVTATASRGATALARTRAAVAAAVARTLVEMDTRNAVATRSGRINIFSDD